MTPKTSYQRRDLEFALKEDIGNPALFTGRATELEFFLDWAEGTKREVSQSHALMARKRRGKTALVQRLYNYLYTRNDPMLVPFYYHVEDRQISQLHFGDSFYRALISQYLGFKLRNLELVRDVLDYDQIRPLVADDVFLSQDVSRMEKHVKERDGETVAERARDAGHRLSSILDVRIIQLIDEFQFLNEYVYRDETFQIKALLGQPYQHTGSSKVSPQIITGSYVGWLSMIVRNMVDRYLEIKLPPLPPEEALALVYNYSTILRFPVTDLSAAYLAEVCQNDPFYIAALFKSRHPARDLTSREAIRETLTYEITDPEGQIRKMWLEYTWHAFDQLNDRNAGRANAKRIVLYLARYGAEERTRAQILEDLELDLTDQALEQLLHKLVRVDMIGRGRSNYDFRGLGDPIFAMVFRHVYQREIEAFQHKRVTIDLETIERDIKRELKQVKGELSYRKGQVAEYRVINRLLMAMIKGVPLERLVRHVPEGKRFGPFTSIRKKGFHLDQEKWLEVDVYCQAEDPAHADLAIEVKDWDTPISQAHIEKFVKLKEQLEAVLSRPTGAPAARTPAVAFLFHAEQGLSQAQEAYLAEHGVMCSDGDSLKDALEA